MTSMIDDELAEIFRDQAADHIDPAEVLQVVHRRITAEHPTRRTGRVFAIAAAVAGIAIGAAFVLRPADPVPAVHAAGGGVHPGLDQLTSTCLDMSKVLSQWGNPSTGWTAVARDADPGATECVQDVQIVLGTRPPSDRSVVAGGRTIQLTTPTDGIRTGFIALDPAQSAAAARDSGQNLDPSVPYFLVASIPADNAESVLVSILQQIPLPE